MSRARRILAVVAAVLAAVLAVVVLVLRQPSSAEVCAHTVAIHPASAEGKETCEAVLRGQASREWPWTFAARMRCYASAPDQASFHDCGGELCHFGE